jgi:F0F1-type ATP synthase assembly protein I
MSAIDNRQEPERIQQMRPLKLTLGAILAILGGAGIILGPLIGLSELGRPWSFILGFIFGVFSGTGTVLSLFGLYETKKGKRNVHKK